MHTHTRDCHCVKCKPFERPCNCNECKTNIHKDDLKIKINNVKANYLIQCDKLRYNDKGEQLWKDMMKNKKRMFRHNFVNYVNVESLLDGESLNDFISSDPDSDFYQSNLGSIKCYFIQTCGFEFIFI